MENNKAAGIINKIYQIIIDRKKQKKENSYTSFLLEEGEDKILRKIAEESTEVIFASKNNKKEEIIHEIADVWFHLLVLMGYKNITPENIYLELLRRANKGKIDNK